ncbi:Retrovirus-related Pol polyprotein from transposon TNT 1-94 [Linum perenne]
MTRLHQGLYHLIITTTPLASNHLALSTSSSQPNQFDLWHYRLGHLSHAKISHLQQSCSSIATKPLQHCSICHFAKQRRLSFPLSTSCASAIFELVHVDIWGPNSIPSYDGFLYFRTIVDDYSRVTWVMMMKSKTETRNHIKTFCSYVSTQFAHSVKCIRSDNGQEFNMPHFFAEHGIMHETSCVETPQQNSRVELNTNTYYM